MSLLDMSLIVGWVLIFIVWFDIFRKQRFNFLHIFIFFWVSISILTFILFPWLLKTLWDIFWVQRGADVLVYVSILFLLYFVLFLFNKIQSTWHSLTLFVREMAIENSEKKIISWEKVFLIRAYNEWKVIEQTLKTILDEWYEKILVVDDGSTDNSYNILKKYDDKIVYIKHLKNRWAWAALETWFEYIRRYWKNIKYIINFDADMQHDIKDLNNFFDKFNKQKDLDVVLWSRFIGKSKTNFPFIRKMVLIGGRFFTFFLSWVWLTDSHNWYRVFTYKFIKNVSLSMDGMAYASELVEKIKKQKLQYAEVPVNIKYTEYSLSKWQKSSNAINIAFTMIRKKFFK